jgi:hypothetical protein
MLKGEGKMEAKNEVNINKRIKKKPITSDSDHIVDEYKIGNTTIKICDDAYRDNTPEDVQRILERVTQIGWKCVRAARKAGKDI